MIDGYIKHLLSLIDLERDSQKRLMADEIRKLTAEARERKGRAVNNLVGKFIKKELKMAIARFSSFKEIDTEIKVGDMVIISRGNPFDKNITGTVTEKRTKSIFVAFSGRIPDWVFVSDIRMDLYVNDITFLRMENNLKRLNDRGRLALQFMLKNSKPAGFKKTSKVNYQDDSLNQFQKNAINNSLHTRNFFLIHGPFGTGKTKTLVELILQEVKNKNNVLVTAESNAAVDNIVERLAKKGGIDITRLGHPQKVSMEIIDQTLISKIEMHDDYSKIKKTKDELDKLFNDLKKYTQPTRKNRHGLSDGQILSLANRNAGTMDISAKTIKSMAEWNRISSQIQRKNRIIHKTEEKIIEDIIKKSDVILTTNSSAAVDEIEGIRFDVAIIDEASQTTIPSVLIPISKAKRFILAGDHKQLPPTVLSEDAKELEITLFERLIEKYPDKKQLLNIQFRMNEMLMKFPNLEFYSGQLLCDDSIKNSSLGVVRKKLDMDSPLIFIDTSRYPKNHETKLKYSKSYINNVEANLAVSIVDEYLNMGISESDIGVISPYSDQVSIIKNKCNVEVKTVDGFQGREKGIIIISTVRSNDKGNIGFLRDLRRLNVAITRAKKKLIIIGNSKTLGHNDTYRRLIDYCRGEDIILEL